MEKKEIRNIKKKAKNPQKFVDSMSSDDMWGR